MSAPGQEQVPYSRVICVIELSNTCTDVITSRCSSDQTSSEVADIITGSRHHQGIRYDVSVVYCAMLQGFTGYNLEVAFDSVVTLFIVAAIRCYWFMMRRLLYVIKQDIDTMCTR